MLRRPGHALQRVNQCLPKCDIFASVQPHDMKQYYSNLRKHGITRLMSKSKTTKMAIVLFIAVIFFDLPILPLFFSGLDITVNLTLRTKFLRVLVWLERKIQC